MYVYVRAVMGSAKGYNQNYVKHFQKCGYNNSHASFTKSVGIYSNYLTT